jgi:xylulokinase
MLCYKNGALAREHVRDKHTDGDWAKFNESVESVPAGNNGHMGLYFPLPEIIPPGVQGEEFLFSVSEDGAAKRVDELPEGTSHARAILESQFLSIRSRITAILPEDAPPLQRLIMTGGGSANTTIRQLAADLFGMRVYVAEDTKEGL